MWTDEEIIEKIKEIRGLLSLPWLANYDWWLTALFTSGLALFNLWKKIVNLQSFQDLQFPIPLPQVIFYFFESIDFLKEKFKEELERQSEEDYKKLMPIWMDLAYCGSYDDLKTKYPDFPEDFLKKRAEENQQNIGQCFTIIEQKIEQFVMDPDFKQRLKAVIDFFKELLPILTNAQIQHILKIIDTLGNKEV